MTLATPWFCGAPLPPGANQFFDWPNPAFQPLPDVEFSQPVKTKVVPDESERCTVMMGWLGKVRPELRPWIAGSLHIVMLPWKMLAIVGGSSFSPLPIPGRL